MASKSAQKSGASVEETDELLDLVDKSLDRLKSLYEQYFLGIQKQAPAPLHSEVERRLRDLQQIQMRNTAHRYRFATLQQKFGSYNSYWRRTLRQIENGTYLRNLSKIGRNAVRTGAEIPEEILAAMPKRMREQVMRDRDAALAQARRRGMIGGDGAAGGDDGAVDVDVGDDDFAGEGRTDGDALPTGHQDAPLELSEDAFADAIAIIKESTELRRQVKNARGPHRVDEADGDLDLNAFFASVEAEPAASSAGANPVRYRSVTRASIAPSPGETPAASAAAPAASAAAAAPLVPAPPPPSATRDRFLETRTAPGVGGIQPMAKQAVAQSFPTTGKPSALPPLGGGGPGQGQGKPEVKGPLASLPSLGGLPPIPAPMPGRAKQPTGPSPTLSSQAAMASARPSQPMAIPTIAPLPPARPSQRMAAVAPAPTPVPPTRPTPVPPTRPTPTPPARVSQPMAAVSDGAAAPASRKSQPIPVQVFRDTPAAGTPVTGMIERPTPPPRSHPITEQSPPPEGAIAERPAPSPSLPRRERPIRREPDAITPTPARMGPPPGMTEGDVNALYARYVKAKEMVGENAGPGAYGKLLKTINAQAPKIMEQYKAKGVDFQIVVKDNQVIIRAKPKT